MKKRNEGEMTMIRVPDYYERFRCLAGKCPHSCCEAWDVVLDEETVERYRREEGALGEKLRGNMVEEDGDMCFALRGGRCPFLDEENLCEIHRRLGEEATSVTCQSHPRFIEEYEELKEITLAASCPAANELLLGEQTPLRFVVTEEGELPADLLPLYALRERALEGLSDRALPLKARLKWLLALAVQAQTLLDEGEEEALLELAQAEPGEVEWETEESEGLFPDALEALAELEVLEEDWVELLAAGKNGAGLDVEEHAPALERICAYFLFRYFCKAYSDGDLLSKVQLALLGTLVSARLGSICGLGEALRCFSREVEHSDENLERLEESFCFDERLSAERFFIGLK